MSRLTLLPIRKLVVKKVRTLHFSRISKLKISISRSSLLTAIVIAVLLVATPFAVWEFVKTGDLYMLSQRFVDEIVAPLHGPGRMRFIFQPTVAIILGAKLTRVGPCRLRELARGWQAKAT
jgi:hypothetical protein